MTSGSSAKGAFGKLRSYFVVTVDIHVIVQALMIDVADGKNDRACLKPVLA